MTIQDIKDKGLLLLECVSGSKAYGLDTAASDTDIKGVFYLPEDMFFGLDRNDQVSNDTNDEVYYELGRFVELLLKNNPNMLELLATPEEHIRYRHPLMKQLTEVLFLSKLCRETFAGYAYTQIKKARGYKKKVVNPMERERKNVPDFCYLLQDAAAIPVKRWLQEHNYQQEQCGLSAIDHTKGMYALFYDTDKNLRYRGIVSGPDANEVSLSSIPKGAVQQGYLFFNQEHYSAYCREYREYWEWVAKRNDARYQGNQAHGKRYDAKNMMHTIRLLQVAEEILAEGKLRIKRSNREELLSIKRGDYEYETLLEMAEVLSGKIERAAGSSTLQEQPDKERINALLVRMRRELYRNWALGESPC